MDLGLFEPHQRAHGAPVGVHGRAHLSERSQVRARGRARRPLAAARADGRPQAQSAGTGIVEPVPAAREHGTGLSNYEYAPLAEIMGRVEWASEAFNCSAPDTGNMEVLLRYGTEEQKRAWLEPAARGRDPLRFRDDRAGRRIVGRDQHRQPRSGATAPTMS